MKLVKCLPLFILLFSCKSYMEYTAGIKEIDYSFDNASVKRFSNLESAMKHPERVVFLDISFATAKDPRSLFKRLNDNINQFVQLKKLTLEGNDTLPIPGAIFNMPKLEFLTLTSFKDTSGLSALTNFYNLRFLGLDFCGLKQVPAPVMKLKNLQGLDLTGNEISALPPQFADLSNLITVDFSNNMFTEIPQSLKYNNKLKYLDFNNAEGIEKDKLSVYRVGVNEIKRIPDLAEFKSLKELYVTYAYSDVDSLNKHYAHVRVQ